MVVVATRSFIEPQVVGVDRDARSLRTRRDKKTLVEAHDSEQNENATTPSMPHESLHSVSPPPPPVCTPPVQATPEDYHVPAEWFSRQVAPQRQIGRGRRPATDGGAQVACRMPASHPEERGGRREFKEE